MAQVTSQGVPTIERMLPEDVCPVVDIHLRAFPGFFLSVLGARFLRLLYDSILEDSSGIAFVSRGTGGVDGFVAGTSEPAGFYRRILCRRWLGFALASTGAALGNPRCIPRLLRALRRPSEESRHAPKCGTLMSIAVHPARQRDGAGRRLAGAFLAEAGRRGLQSVSLTTDRAGNDVVNTFYSKLGFVLVRDFITPEGRSMNEYRIELGPDGRGDQKGNKLV